MRYSEDNWELTIGRQRINWGVNLAFNPNDLFNAYSLIDFDYQERPGVDAVRFQYYGDDMSSFEGAVQIGNSLDSSLIAGLWKFNKWKYDFQFLAANYFKDIAVGTIFMDGDNKLAKINDILIIVNKGQLDQYKKILPNGKNLGIKISYLEQNEPRGLPDAFVIGEKFIGKENVAMILGDNFFYGQSLSKMLIKDSLGQNMVIDFRDLILNPDINSTLFDIDRLIETLSNNISS